MMILECYFKLVDTCTLTRWSGTVRNGQGRSGMVRDGQGQSEAGSCHVLVLEKNHNNCG